MTQQHPNILPSPFPGLRPFRTEETHLFFGREGQIDEVLTKMSKHRFVAVLGTSGSGKSSFMYCGLIPSLYGGFMTEAGANWRVVVTRPGSAPIDNLSRAITQSELPDAPEEKVTIQNNVNQAVLRSSSLGLAELVKQVRHSPDEQILILVDQFEELFRFNQDIDANHANETLAFVKLLSEAVAQRQVPIYVVMTMRSDYIGDCAEFPDFTSMINDSHYLIPQMTREQKRQAVLGPVAVGGGKMSSRLVQQLLNDLGSNPDQLPILQHALMRTWDFWATHAHTDNEELDLYHYESIGGMAEALSMHANEAYEELSTEEQELCCKIFKCLTEKGADGRGIRRPTKVCDIAEITEESEEKILAIVERFRRPGRTLLMPSMLVNAHSNTVLDISHESLMRIWDRLRGWVQEESESVKVYLRLAEAAAMFQLGTSSLWRPPDLQVAMAWEEKEKPNKAWGLRYHPTYERTMNFLANSKQAYEEEQRGKEKMQKKRLQRARLTALILGLAMIVSSFFLVYAQIQTLQAEENLELARVQEEKAIKNQLEADKLRKRAENKALEAEREKLRANEKATEAEQQRQYAERASRRAQEARIEALRSAAEADSARTAAEENAIEAARQKKQSDRNAELAKREQSRAEKERQSAQKLRFKAIAQTMAVKSLQLEDSAQEGLVAQQAFLFNEQYNDKELDSDIYNGLYYARKKLEGEAFNIFQGNPHKGVVAQVTSGEDGSLYSVGHDGCLKKWNATTGESEEVLQTSQVFKNIAIQKGKDGTSKYALGSEEGIITIGVLEDPLSQRKYNAHKGNVWGVHASQNQKGIISYGSDGLLMFQSWDGNEVYPIYYSAKNKTKSISEVPNASYWIGLLESGEVIRFENAPNSAVDTVMANTQDKANTLTVSPNGNELAIGTTSGKVSLWNIETRQFSQLLTGHSALISQIRYSSDGKWLATSSFDGKVLLWDRRKLSSPIAIFNDHEGWVWSVEFAKDNQSVITASGSGVIKEYELNMESHAKEVAKRLSRSLSLKEWEQFVGKDIDYPYADSNEKE